MPFCAFNGGRDVFVDVGSKDLGIASLQRMLAEATARFLARQGEAAAEGLAQAREAEGLSACSPVPTARHSQLRGPREQVREDAVAQTEKAERGLKAHGLQLEELHEELQTKGTLAEAACALRLAHAEVRSLKLRSEGLQQSHGM